VIASERLLRAILGFVTALLALAFISRPLDYRPPFFEPAGVFHYYLGAKYATEVGPFDLYACAMAADGEHAVWDADTLVRDLRTYRLVPAWTQRCPRDRFTPQRWNAFAHDVVLLTGLDTPVAFAGAVTDKGYNATPLFSSVFGRLAALVPVDRARTRVVLFNLDILFVAFSIGIVWYSGGTTLALLTLLLSVGFFGNFGRIGGNFGQYAWVPCLTLAVAAWRARRPVLAGGALGIAAGLQAFPLLFAVPIVVGGLRALLRRDRAGSMRALWFTASVVVALGLSVVAGSTSPRGLAAWREWREKIAVHSSYLRGEVFDIGLPRLVADAVSRDRADSDSYTEDTPHTWARNAALGAHLSVWRLVAGLLIVLMCGAIWGVPEEAQMALGFVPIYALLALSPYYYFALALLPFMIVGLDRSQFVAVVGLLVVVLGIQLAIWGQSYISFVFWRHAASEVLMATVMLAIPVVPLAGRLRRWLSRRIDRAGDDAADLLAAGHAGGDLDAAGSRGQVL
jgi:hypothetical protein